MSRGGARPEDPLRTRARRAAADPAVEWTGGVWSYGRLDAAADRVAGALRSALTGPDDLRSPATPGAARRATPGPRHPPRPPAVAAFLPPAPESVAAIHGVPRAGAALAPLHAGSTEGELAGVLARLEPRAVLVTEETAGLAGAALRDRAVPRLPLDDAATGEAPGRGLGPGPPSGGRAPVHSIVSTSGSSGQPRLVELTAANHLASARAVARRLALAPADRWLASLSFAHVGGLAMAVRAAAVGSTLVLRGRFDAAAWSEALDEAGVTHVSLVPTTLRRLLAERGDRRAPESLAAVLLGGAAADPGLLEAALARGWPVALTYGLTEAASQVATAEPARVRRKPGTVGPPLRGTQVRLDAGEILVRGPTVMRGYWDEPSDRPRGGWLRTGDLGRRDEAGDLWIVGRRSARIVSGGVNVDPAEVEAVLTGHPGVRDAVVVGIPDPEWGERVVAVVEPDEPPLPGDLAEALERLCRERLSGPKRPKAFRFLAELPRTPTGKPHREAVRRTLEEETG